MVRNGIIYQKSADAVQNESNEVSEQFNQLISLLGSNKYKKRESQGKNDQRANEMRFFMENLDYEKAML